MIIHIKNNENTEKYLAMLQALLLPSSEVMKTENWKMFTEIQIPTTYEDRFSAIVREERYMSGKYTLVIYDRADHEREVSINITDIDCVYSL